MGRKSGKFSSVANFELKLASPFDARLLVGTKSDLINIDTWPRDGNTLYVYKGMIVSVADEGNAYMLVDPDKATNEAGDYSGWKMIGSSDEVMSLAFESIIGDDGGTMGQYEVKASPYTASGGNGVVVFLSSEKRFAYRVTGNSTGTSGYTAYTDWNITGESKASDYAFNSGVTKIFTANDGKQYTWNDEGNGLVEYSPFVTEKDVQSMLDDLDVSSTYDSAISDTNLKMPSKVGGIAADTPLSALEGRSISSILDDLLFPTIEPTFTNPSATLKLSGYSQTQEVGAASPTAENPDNFTESFDQGKILVNGVEQSKRAGALKTGKIYATDENSAMPTTVALGATNYYYKAEYNAGPQPKDNKGNNSGEALAAGSVTSPACTVYGTYPWYASTSDATEANPVVKQALIKWNETAGKMVSSIFELQPSGTLPQVFKLPRAITKLEEYNDQSSNADKMDEITWENDFNETTEQIAINGNERTYYVYTYKGDPRGKVKLRVSF